jgi:AraC-like DNA-binding protein
MASASGAFRSLRFSRVPLAAGDFRSDVGHALRRFGFARRIRSVFGDGACHADIAIHVLGRDPGDPDQSRVCIHRASHGAGILSQRTPDILRNDDVVLHIQESGARNIVQLGREAAVGAHGGVLSSNADVSTVVLPSAGRFVSIGLPRKLMRALVPGLEDAFARPLRPNTGALRLLWSYADVVEDAGTPMMPDLQSAMVAHIHDLCALAIGAAPDAAEIARGRGLRAARLHAIKADIASNLSDGDVSVTALARRQGVTARYVQRLFESDGTTLSRFVLRQRLLKVHRMLADPRHADCMISALAYDAGFGDLSTFNREFRRFFGATPSDIRAAAHIEATALH